MSDTRASEPTKVCSNCNEVKSLKMFNRNKSKSIGIQCWCRKCSTAKNRKWRTENIHRIRSQRRALRRAGIEKSVSLTRRPDYKRDPIKKRAQHTLYSAIRNGTVVRPKAYSKCGKIGPVQGHHADYSKPLEVVWLCSFCHGEERWTEKREALEGKK